MRIALVHDYLKEYGGAERVLLALHEIYPQAPIMTIYSIKGSKAQEVFKEATVIQSWFSKIPFCSKLISPLRFLIPFIWQGFDFSDYDLVISSASWAVTKGFALGKIKEICYCHTPPRYLYGYDTSKNWKKHWYLRFYALIVNHFMRIYDFNQAQKVTQFVANSKEVQERIKKYYRRESVVINPPVDIPKLEIRNSKSEKKMYFLTGGRLEAAKNFDLIIKACNQLKIPLKIYGSGTQQANLASLGGSEVEFLGRVTEQEKFALMAQAQAFIVMAKDEDFGITPVEAMAAGTPVIAFKGGGYQETIIEGKTGVFVKEATVKALVETLKNFKPSDFKTKDCLAQAEKFSKEKFKKQIGDLVENNA